MSIPSTPESFIAANKQALDTVFSLVNGSLSSTEKLFALNISTTRNLFEEQIEGTKNLLSAKDPREAVALQNALIQPQIEKLSSYSRSVHEIVSDAQEQYVKLLENKHAELNKGISSVLDWYAKSASSSDVTVAAVKSAISAANSAFENVNRAARKVADITEASVIAASSATERAVVAASQTKKKAA